MRTNEVTPSGSAGSRLILRQSRDVVALFLLSLGVRMVFAISTGKNFNFNWDWDRYDLLSDRVLALNFDFEMPEFIVAPLYPIFLAAIKFVFGSSWVIVLEISQSALSAVETVLLYKISLLLWENRRVSVLAALAHTFYPPGFMFVVAICQETLFECLWVACIYWLILSVKDNTYRSVCISAMLFGLAYLTKSHILLFSPFVCVYYLLNADSLVKAGKKIVLFGLISFSLSIPWGIHNWRTKGVYILSSTGYGSHFLVAHCDENYTYLFDPPPIGTKDWFRLNTWTEYGVFREISAKREETGMSDKEFQRMCYEYGVRWCRENPVKYFQMNVRDVIAMLRPGASKIHQPFKLWLASFLICTPVFVLAYVGIVRNLRSNFRLHFWILGIFLSMLIYILPYYFQGRFRAVTIEQFYLIYAAFMVDRILARIGRTKAGVAP